jgi:uncharacterized protein
MTDRVLATASVATATPERYAKQLAAHLGRRCEVRDEATGVRLIFPDGDCLLRVQDESPVGPGDLGLIDAAGR